MDDDQPWIPPCLEDGQVDEGKTYVSGWVNTEEDLQTVLESHKRASLCTFVKWSDDAKKKQKTERRLLWKYQDIESNTPFIVTRSVVMACQFGKPRRKDEKTNKEIDHQYIRGQRFHIQTTKKVDCVAKLSIRYVTRYPQYSVDDKAGRLQKQNKLDTLSSQLKDEEEIQNLCLSESKIYVKLPLKNAHSNHNITVESGYGNSMHPDLKLIIKQNVEMGLTSVPYLRKVLQQHVKTNLLSPDMIHPAQTDRSYYPTSRDIYNFIHQYLASGSFSGLDQENLKHKTDEWKGNTSDMFFFRPCSGSKPNTKSSKNAQRVLPASESEDEEEEEDDIGEARESSDISSNEKNTFLFVHQTENQKKILDKYGKFVLIDATYKTSKYALPLFLVVVRTNVRYVPVGQFIVESENVDNISEAISILKKWNPNWEPQSFMMDYSEVEFQAVHLEFPSANKFLCIFHIEQAWLRWTKKRKSNLTDDEAAEFLKLMREVLRSSTQENYETAVSNLKSSSLYAKENVQKYLDRYWLSIPERWCRAFIDAGFNSMLRTNNGVEALNSSLKNYYTKLTGTGTITNLVEIIVSDFIPDQINSFRRLNYCYSSQYRQYNTHVPDFLRNLPRNVVKHCLVRYASATDYSNDDIDEVSNGVLLVKSEHQTDQMYQVEFGTEDRLPSCSCDDFLKFFLPCKHFFAVIRNTKYTWQDLSPTYINSPYLQLDTEFLSPEAVEVSVENTDESNMLQLMEVQLECNNEEIATANQSLLSKARGKVRESLKIVEDLTYLSQDSDVLNNMNDTLGQIITQLELTVQRCDNLPLNRPLPQRKNMKNRVTTKKSTKLYVKEDQFNQNRKTRQTTSRKRKISNKQAENDCSADIIVEPFIENNIHTEAEQISEESPPEKVMRSQKRNLTSQHSVITAEAEKFRQRKLQQLQNSSGSVYPTGGLLNGYRKNLCFANSLLQCLRLTDMHRILQFHPKCKDLHACFTCGLRDFIETAPVTAEPLCRQLTRFWPAYKIGQQEDCHELLVMVMGEVEENCFGQDEDEDERRIFFGKMTYLRTCTICNTETTTNSSFFDISVSIANGQNVAQAVADYFTDEEVQKMCSHCRKDTLTTVKKRIENIPENIIIQLQRSNAEGYKVMKKVDVHLNLFFKDYIAQNVVSGYKAELFGVIVHYGRTLNSGHYYAYIKFAQKWYRVDDTHIEEASIQHMKKCEGEHYLLFYKRQ